MLPNHNAVSLPHSNHLAKIKHHQMKRFCVKRWSIIHHKLHEKKSIYFFGYREKKENRDSQKNKSIFFHQTWLNLTKPDLYNTPFLTVRKKIRVFFLFFSDRLTKTWPYNPALSKKNTKRHVIFRTINS